MRNEIVAWAVTILMIAAIAPASRAHETLERRTVTDDAIQKHDDGFAPGNEEAEAIEPVPSKIAPVHPTRRIEILVGVDSRGRASRRWLELIRKRLPEREYRAIESLERPLTTEEEKWVDLIRSKAAGWIDEAASIALAFDPAPAPPRVSVILGNRGGSDAFTHDAMTIGFDLAVLQQNYGSADDPSNAERINRFFRHEYTHLMQKSWMSVYPPDARTPLERAVLGTWLEGLGNYQSLSSRWRARDGELAPPAKEALSRLEPRFSARFAALACADESAENILMSGHSEGPFDQKWGALTLALWLDQEMSLSSDAFRRLVVAGPEGVWEMAGRHLPGELGEVLEEARKITGVCSE